MHCMLWREGGPALRDRTDVVYGSLCAISLLCVDILVCEVLSHQAQEGGDPLI